MLGNGELADVVQQCRGAQRFDFVRRQTDIFRDLDCVDANPLQMRMSGLVFGLDCERQSLNGPHVERGNIFDMPLFDLNPLSLGFQAAQIKTVRTVKQVNYRQHQQRRLPALAPVDHAHKSHYRSPNKIVGERPEVALLPDPAARFAFGERNDEGNRQSIREKENQRRHQQQKGLTVYQPCAQPVVADITDRAGVRHHPNYVKQDFDGIQTISGLPNALDERGGAADDQRLRQT